MDAADQAWALLTEGPLPLRTTVFGRFLDSVTDPLAVVLECAARLANADPSLRQSFGNVLALRAARHTPSGPLDARIDGVVGLLGRAFRHDELIYGRIPPERLAAIATRILGERPKRESSEFAHDLLRLVQRAPEATPAFLTYLAERNELKRLAPGGDLAVPFQQARAAVPRLDELAAALPRKAAAPARDGGSFEIVRQAEARSPSDVEALGRAGVAQFLAAAAAVTGRKKVASVRAAFAAPLREGEAPLVAVLHQVRDDAHRYDLWTFFDDTGVVFLAGSTRKAGVDWIQGAFEASRPAQEGLARALAAARWR